MNEKPIKDLCIRRLRSGSTEMPFRSTFQYKIKCSVNATQTQRAISQKHAESDDTERSDLSTIDTHLQTKPLIVYSYSAEVNLLSCQHLVTKFSHFLSVCIQMTVAMEVTTTDHVARDPSISLVFP